MFELPEHSVPGQLDFIPYSSIEYDLRYVEGHCFIFALRKTQSDEGNGYPTYGWRLIYLSRYCKRFLKVMCGVCNCDQFVYLTLNQHGDCHSQSQFIILVFRSFHSIITPQCGATNITTFDYI